jgi:thiomorpholine-carboxylate dehydrogenase
VIPFLDEADVRSTLEWRELIRTMEAALAAFSTGRVVQPMRQWLGIDRHDGYLGVMPAAGEAAMGIKLVTLYPRNTGTPVPSVMAIVVLFSTETGEPLALMDGRLITEMRTAAVSAAVTDRVAAPESRVLALLGSGVQARAHLGALSEIRRFDDVRVWSATPEHAARFADELGCRATDAETAVRGADVVVTATHAREPVLKGAWLKPGAHVNAIGAPMPTWRELDDAVMANIVIADSRDAVAHESGDVILSKAPIFAEAGELFAGLSRCPPGATTVFKSVGLAIEDIATAKLVFDRWSATKQQSR